MMNESPSSHRQGSAARQTVDAQSVWQPTWHAAAASATHGGVGGRGTLGPRRWACNERLHVLNPSRPQTCAHTRTHARTRTHAHTHTHTRMHIRTHIHTHTHTHRLQHRLPQSATTHRLCSRILRAWREPCEWSRGAGAGRHPLRAPAAAPTAPSSPADAPLQQAMRHT